MIDSDDLLTRNAAADVLHRDRRTIRRALEDVVPDEPASDGKPARWCRLAIVRALAAHQERTAPWRNGGGASETVRERTAAAVERAAARMQAALDRLRSEPDLEKRRAMFFAGMPEIGALDRAFAEANAAHPHGELVEPWCDQTVRRLLGEILGLVQIGIAPTSPA
jgi:hypothetical protein